MNSVLKIEKKYADSITNLALDTLKNNKQALIFVNTKRSAEKCAEEISKKLKQSNKELTELSNNSLKAVQKSTKQCKRLSLCLEKGIAFHHASLHSKQKDLIETSFRKGTVKIICCTPTLCISKDTKLWQGINEINVSKFNTSKSLCVLSKNKLITMHPQKIQRNNNFSKLIQISSVSGYSIKITSNHKMYIKRKNKKLIVAGGNIKKDDKIATIGKLNINNELISSIKDFIVDNQSDINFKFDSDTAYFIGVMLGDGYSGAETDNDKIKYKGSPSIVGIDKEVFSQVKKMCCRLKLNCREIKNFHGTPQLILGKNNWFREFLVRCGVEVRDKKYISNELMSSSLENISSLLKGLFDTDGFINKQKNIGFSNISEKLVKQMQKLLLRVGIVSRIRIRKEGTMKIYEKEYKTQLQFELIIDQKRSILDFYRFIGFNIQRKQEDLTNLIVKICSNLNYVSCNNCGYKVYQNLFSGRSASHKKWGKNKLKIIKLLGMKKEVGSKEIKTLLKFVPRKKDRRLNHHYELIKKKRIGGRKNTEFIWSLNEIGGWIFNNIINKQKLIKEFFHIRNCPLCQNKLDWIIKKGWRDNDFDGDIFWDKIREIKKVPCENHVYDIVLPNHPKNNHLFVAEGFIIHNSAGLDLPAFRAIIRDVKRYTGRGMVDIPVLEYLQMSGRAGRPNFDKYGEAILVSSSEGQKDALFEKYVHGEPEDIYSKLAVEPVLRTYLLSLIATKVIRTKEQILDFFSKTFWAFQFKDMKKLEKTIIRMLKLLESWEFIQFTDTKFRATVLGKRIAELYIDPFTASEFVVALDKAKDVKPIALLQLVSNTLEMRPLLRVKLKEYDDFQDEIAKYESYFLTDEPSMFDSEYDDYLNSVKTSFMLNEWVEEKDDDFLMNQYDVGPGITRMKIETANWLLYALYEIARIQQKQDILKDIVKLKFRLKYGVKEELLPLLKLKNIGRIRARKLFRANLKKLSDVRKAKPELLAQIIGSKKLALDVLDQVGADIGKNNNKGQLSNFSQ